MDLLSGEGELAAFLSHEISHLLAQHPRESADIVILQSIVMAPLLPMFVGAFYAPRLLLTAFTTIAAGTLSMLNLRRCQEREADYIGMLIMAEAGFDPAGATALWNKYAAFEDSKEFSFLQFVWGRYWHPSVS